MALRKTTRNRFGKAGAHPQLAWESQLPLKPCLSLQPFNFKGNCDSSDSLLDFCFLSLCSFNLLRKCGLLAHTSPTFLKNCWIKKLFSCLWLVPYNPPRKNLPRTIPQTAIPFNTATKPHFPQFPVFLRLTNFRKSPIIKSVPIEQLYARRFSNAAHFIR